jgi:hypothetical protein
VIGGAEGLRTDTSPAEEARVSEEITTADAAAPNATAVPIVESGSLDQPEDEATEHALRLMNEALRRSGAGRRWLVAGDP